MKHKILFYSNAWGDYIDLRKRLVEPVVKRVISLSTDNCRTCYSEEDDIGYLHSTASWCFQNDHIMIMIPPDTFIPAESILNLIELAKEGRHIAIPHLRVNRETFIPDKDWTNVKACAEAAKNLHHTAELSKEKRINLWRKGIRIRELPDQLVFTHALPTIYACKFDISDIKCLKDNLNYKYVWDNQFLHNAFNTNRLRIIGSSDTCCAFETTKKDENLPQALETPKDDYQVNRPENRGCQMTMYTMRCV